ncbi:MAG TPA: type II secretion system protein GspM [Rudaea sp.]|nr:type II secretion system protein GspM [Rudaea sp.]
MRLLPEARNRRFLALVLLLIAAIVVYLLGVHWWFVAPHLAISEQMNDLRDQESRFSQIVAQRPQIERRLAEARAFEQNNQAFLTDADPNSAFSDIVQRLKQTISAHVGESTTCQTVSTSPFKNAEEELYQRVTAQVRMRCGLEHFSDIVYDLEGGNPYLFIDRLTIYRQLGGYVPPGNRKAPVSALEIQFNLSGYLRQAGGKAPAP